MDPSRDTPDMSPVDKDGGGGGGQSESIFQLTEKTDDEKTIRLKPAEETAPTATQNEGANSGLQEITDNSDNTQAPLKDLLASTADKPSSGECLKGSTDSKCDTVEDYLANDVQVQMETTNCINEKSSVPIESSSSSKSDDENILIPNKPQPDTRNLPETPSLAVSEGKEEDASKDDEKCLETVAPNLVSEAESAGQKLLIPSSEEKPLFTSEEKTLDSSSEKRSSVCEENPHRSPSELLSSASEEKSDSKPSEKKPLIESFNEKPPSSFEKNTSSTLSEETPHSESSVEEKKSASEEKSPSSPSEQKYVNESSDIIRDEKQNPSEDNIPSASIEGEDNDLKAPCFPTEKSDERKVPSTSFEEKVSTSSSEMLCDEEKTDRPSEEICVEEENINEAESDVKEKNEVITPNLSSEEKSLEVKKEPSSLTIEEECVEDLSSSSPPSEDKPILEKAPSSSPEETSKGEKTVEQPDSDEKPENADSLSENECSAVLSSSVKIEEEQKLTECSGDVTAKSSSELVNVKVNDENVEKCENSITNEESKESAKKFEIEEIQESNNLLEKCVTESTCQSDESNGHKLNKDESEELINYEDKSTKDITVESPVVAADSADIQCSKPEEHDLLVVDSSSSKNETSENDKMTGSNDLTQNKIDESSESDVKISENEVSSKSDIKEFQNEISESARSNSSAVCAENNDKVESDVSKELISGADLCDKRDIVDVSQKNNEETCESAASVSKSDGGLKTITKDCSTSEDQQLSSNTEKVERNKSGSSSDITIDASGRAEELLCSTNKETTSIKEKFDDSSLLCDEILDKSEDQGENATTLPDVDNASKDTPQNVEDEKVVGSENRKNMIKDSKIEDPSSKLAEDAIAVKIKSSSGVELQITSNKKDISINLPNERRETSSSVEELSECVNSSKECSKDVGLIPKNDEKGNCGNSVEKSSPRENIQSTASKKEESNVAPDNVEETKTSTVEIQETAILRSVNDKCAEKGVSNPQDSIKSNELPTNTSIQITANTKLVTGGSLVVNNSASTPGFEKIIFNKNGDSSNQIKDISGVKSKASTDIQNSVEIQSVGKKKQKPVKRKSVSCATNTLNFLTSRVNRNPPPILPRPQPIASTSTFVGNPNSNTVPLKVSKATTTDFISSKPLILSPMDVQRISEMKPTNPQMINPDQLHKNICIIKTLKPATQDVEKGGKPKKVSIDCQVDESELTPVGGPYQSVVNDLSARQATAPALPCNPNNQIVVTVRGTFANATNHPTSPSIPVKIDNSVNTAANQERISEAVKFFFQGPTNLDRFFQPNTVEAGKLSPNYVPSVKEQVAMQQASFEQDRNRTAASKKKDSKKLTPILPKPPGMMRKGEYFKDQSIKLDGQLSVSSAVAQQPGSGEVKMNYAAEGGSKLQQVVDKLYLAQESVMAHDSNDDKVEKIDLTTDSPIRSLQPTKEFLSNLKLPSNLTVIPQKVKKQKKPISSMGHPIAPPTDKVEGSVFARLQKLGTVIEVERDASDKLAGSRSETSSPSATPNSATQPDYAQCLRVLDNLTQAGQILASIKKVNPKTAAKSKMNLKPMPNLKKIEVPSMTNKPNLQRRSSLPSDATNRSSPGLAESTAARPATPSEISSRVNLNENEHCLKIASNPELTIIPKKHLNSQGPPAALTPPPTIIPVVAASTGIDCAPLQKTLHFEQQLNCPPTISITTEESGGRNEAEQIKTFRFQLDVSQVREKSEGERVLNCDICSAEYPKVASLKRHYLRKHINARYISDQDKQSYLAPSKNKNSAESSSQKSNAEEDENMTGLYKCSSCRECFDEKNDLKNHMFEQHILGSVEFKTFDCSKCSETFDNIKEFVAHRKICSQKLAPPQPLVSLQLCLYCEQTFVNIAARNKHHNKFHHFKKKYQKCLVCDSDKYRDKSSLFKHMCTEHKNDYFGCENCHLRFAMEADLERHNKLKHASRKADKKSSTQSSSNEDANKKPTDVVNKVEVNQLPSENRLKNESTEVKEKVETQTKPTKNVNTEVNSKYELAKKLVRIGPPIAATASEIPDKTADNKVKNDSKAKEANKKKPEPKTVKDSKVKPEDTKDVEEKNQSSTATEDKVDKVVENISKSETDDKEGEKTKLEDKKKKPISTHKCSVCNKVFGSSSNVTRHKRLTHGLYSKKKSPTRKEKTTQKMNVFSKSDTVDETEQTVLHDVYGNVENSGDNENNPNSFTRNVKENLLHHLDGKLDSQEVMENDTKSRAVAVPKRRLSFSASFQSSERESGDKDCKEGLLPVSPKSSIEKYSFPKNYDGCGGLTSYFKDMSHLDLFTQKAMRFTPQNASFEMGGASSAEFHDIPTCLELVKTERSEQDEGPFTEVEFSGEWTRPRRYICAVCNYCTGELWDIEEHKVALHPNVWCPHNEVLVEEAESWQVVYHKRQLTTRGVLGGKAATSPVSSTQLRCTKCNKVSGSLPDFHRHVLDCGGDTTWAITMLGVSSPGNRRNRKWRPFGSRRRRQQGRRGLKRNIPNTPAKQPGMKIRTKPGDMETIQRMIANLPAKRVSRRVFGDDNEVKTRSQGTISSGSIYSTPFTYQFNNKTAALAKKQAAKLIKPKIVTNVNLSDSPKKDDKKTKSSSEASEKPQTSKKSQSKESAAESPKSKKLKTPDKIKSGTSEKTADPNTQVKSSLKREHSRVDKGNSPGKEDNIGAPEAKKKQKLKHNAFNVKEGASEKSADKLLVSGKSKLQTWDMTIVENKSVLEVGKNESTNPSTAVSRPKASSKPTKQDSDRQKRSSDDFRKSLDDFRKRMCIDGNLIICSGCGTQFDNSSACQRHMKKCSYCTGKAAGGLSCSQCNSSFSSEELKLAHVCDDRAMPQLSPEEPYPVATEVPAATEDIPVLSPEEIGKNKNENNNEDTKKGPRLTRSESRASISESLKSEKLSSEETKSPVTTRNSRSSLRQKPLGELNKLAQDETSNVDSSNKQISRVLRHRSITSVSGPDDDDGGDSKTTAAKLDESSDVSTKNTPKPTVTRGKKRPLEDDVETNDKGDEENSRRETRRGSIMNKISKLDSSETEKDEISSNENRRKSTRLSIPNEINTENNAKKISMEFLKETSETGERQGKRFLCEVCDKVIMEIYLRKHVEAGIHARNVELRGDFDNLFPDEQKFITSCDICNLSFSSPFLSYKHKLQHHEDSLMELIETSMIEPIKKEIKQEVMEVEDEDDNESLIKTKDKLMSKKASEGKPKIDDSLNNVSKTKVDSNKSKTKGADAPSTETEKTSNKRKSLSSSLLKEDEKANKGEKNATGSSLSDVTVKSEDTTSGNSDKRALRARRNSLPNEPTTKSEDNMILNPELRLLREGRRSSLRLDSSLGKPKETVESEKPIESVPSKNESTKESSVTNTDLQLRGRRSLPSADSSGTVDNKDNSTTEVNKSLNQSSSANDSTGECEDGPVTRSDSATRKAAVIAPSTESTDKEDEVVHEATEFVNKSGKPMMSCFICDRSVGKYAYNKHSNSVIHNQNTKFRKEFLEKYADSKVITCPECKVDFSNSYFCFRHTMELHPEIVVRMFGSVRTTRSLSSKEEKQVIIDTETDKKVLSSKETPSIQHSTNNKQSSGKETLVSPTASNKKTSILSPKAKNEANHDENTIDSKKNVPTISASKDVVQTTMFEFFKKASTSSLKEDSSTDLKNANEATQNPKTASSKKSTPISSAEKSKTAAVKNADVNVTLTTPSKMESEISPFDFVNETSAPILSYREVTQSKSKKIIDNNRKSVVDPTASTKYDATFDCNKKSENPVPKGVLAADLAMKSSANDTENKKIVVKKSSPSIGIDGKAALSYSTFNKKAVDNTPESTGKELKSKESAGVNTTDKHDTESEGNILESCSLPDEVDPSEVKPVNILFCATCHKRVKIESLQKHSTSLLHKTNYDQSNFEYEVPDNCDRCKMFENFPFACRAHQKSVLKSKKKKRKRSDDESSKKLVKSLLGKMSKKKLNKLKKRQKQKQSEKLAETKINRLKKMKINNWQVSVVKKEENERSEKKASSTITSQEFELQSRSPTTSEFDCLLCNKQFNSALLLVEHQNTTVHKMNASRHALKNNPLPILPSTIIPSLVKTVPLPSLTPPQVPAPSPKENEGNLIEQTASLSNANVGTDQDLTQTAGEAILAYGWQDTDWSSVRNMSGWDNQSLAGSSSSGAPDTNMSAFWETDVTSSFMGGRSSLGSILDSVNKILADPGLSTDPHYNLTDLQSEVGAYHDNMFGERSNFLQDMSTSGETSTSNASSVQENWSYPPSVEDGSTATFMDLDNQTAHHPPHPATLTPSLSHSSTDLDKNSASGAMQQQQPQKRSRKRKSSADSEGRGYYQAPIDYESKATECRKCGRKFVGIAALQLHVASCADLGSSSIGNAAFLKRSSVLYTSFNSSLVCQKCKEILNSPEALRSHVCDLREKSESKSSSEKSTNADIMNKEGAEKLKSKMSIALGSLLDKALNNLLGAKNLQEPDLNTSAIQLLGKLCAVRRKSQQNMTSSAVAKSGSSSADTAAAGSAATQTSTATNTLDLRTLNFKTSAKLRSVMAGEHSVPKLPWLTGERSAGTGTTGSSTSPMVIKPAAPSPETLVDHFAMRRSENQLSLDNSYACPVCGEKFSMPSLRNNHLYMHQEVAARPRSLPALNPDERSQTSQNQNNPNEKGWRSVACSSSDLVFLAENLEGQQSTVRPHCSGDGGDSRPVSENIIDSTSGDEHRAKKSAKIGAGTSKAGGGEKSLPALEPIAGASAQAITGETLRKTPLRRGTSDEESLSVKTEMAVQTEFEEDIDAERRQSAKFAAKMRRMVLAPEEVRVKAEAALRELSLQKSCVNKADSKNLLSGSCKYGNYRYTQKEDSSSAATGAAPTPPPHIETKADVTEMTTSHPNNTHQ